MKKFLVVLVVFFFLQTVLPNLKSLPTDANVFGQTLKIEERSVDMKSCSVSSVVQDFSKEIKTNDVTDAFKQSIQATEILKSGGSYWAKTYGGNGQDEVLSIQQTSD